MRVFRAMVITMVIAALMVTALATTAVAGGKGKLAFVQGNPSTKVDLCVNGREKASAVRFGKVVRLKLAPGKKMFRFHKAAAGNCKGQLLASKKILVYSDTDRTVVLSKKDPNKVMSFDNIVPPPPVALPYVDGFFRHAADMGKMIFYFETDSLPITVAGAMPWSKGLEVHREVGINPPGGAPQWSTTWVGKSPAYFPPTVAAGPRFAAVREGYRYEWILIGTKTNHMLKVLRTDV